MSQDNLIRLKCTENGHVIWTFKNKKKNPEPLELKKFNPILKKRTVYKESKKR